ncbi:MAG: hypothetical protein KDB16_12625, partial [Acidimicrobiales bacterium]|nr:hypothetical protein [Acidimicrobiales bacterium]
MFAKLHPTRALFMTLAITALAGFMAVFVSKVDERGADAAVLLPHGQLVPEMPETGFPRILGSRTTNNNGGSVVYAADQVGNYIVAGGSFTQIELQDGTTLQQNYFAAFDIDTKQMVCAGQFQFDREIRSFEPGASPTQVYVGGKFRKVTGSDGIERTRNKVALIDLADCSVSTDFVSIGANGKITAIHRLGDRLFVGGDFTTIGGADVETIAELDATTGDVRTQFDFVTNNEGWGRVMDIGTTPDGNRLVFGGRFGNISGNGLTVAAPTAVIDISDPNAPALTSHESTGYAGGVGYITDVSVSPDGSVIGVSAGKATSADYVYLVDATDGRQSYRWRHYMRDSTFAIGVSDAAVYVGGHFCKVDTGPGPTDVMSPKMGFNVCTGSGRAGGAWRTQIAALSLTDGTPLAWNPGSDAWVGHREFTITTRGLLTGFDGNRVNDRRVGSLAFFDLGPDAEDNTAPSPVQFTAPAAGAQVNSPATISGTATDDVGVSHFLLKIQSADGRWVQADGSLGQAEFERTVFADQFGGFEVQIASPAGSYVASAVAVDHFFNQSPTATTLAFTQTGFEQNPPVTTIESDGLVGLETRAVVSGVAEDDSVVDQIVAQVRTSDGRWVADGGTIVDQQTDYPVSIVGRALGKPRVRWEVDLGGFMPPDVYTVDVTVSDASGNSVSASATIEVADRPPFALDAALAGQTGGTLRNDGSYTLGYAFTLDQPREVSALGIRDANSNEILDNPRPASVAIWRVSNRQLMAQVEVAPDTVRRDGWFYANVDGIVTLEAGVEYVIGFERFVDGEGFVNFDVTPAPIDGVLVTRRAYQTGANGIVYPAQMTGGTTGYGMPNMLLRVPVDTTPTVAITGPQTWNLDDEALRLTATAGDNLGVASIELTAQHEDGRWLTSNGDLVATRTPVDVELDGAGEVSAAARSAEIVAPPGRYTATALVTDVTGNTSSATATFNVGPVAFDDSNALLSQTGGTFRTDNNYVLGYTFTLDEARSLLGLSIFDANHNGINDNPRAAQVGVWRRDNQQLVASVDVPADAPVVDGWFGSELATPVDLQPGVEYVVGFVRMSDGEGFYNPDATVTPTAGMRIIRSAWVSSTTLRYPGNQGGASAGYGSPNLTLGVPRDGRPALVVDQPPAQILAEESLTIEGTATDNAAVATVVATLQAADGQWVDADGNLGAQRVELPLAIGGAGTPQLTFRGEVTTVPVGSYTLVVEATDGAGNTTAETRQLTVSNDGQVDPVVTIDQPTGQLPNGQPVVGSGSVSDNGAVASIVAEVRSADGRYLQDDGTLAATPNQLNVATVGLGSPTATWLLEAGLLEPNDYELTVIATDGIGNTGSATSQFTVTNDGGGGDNQAPVVADVPAQNLTVGSAVDLQ